MLRSLLTGGLALLALVGPSAAPPSGNPVSRENALPGTGLWQPFTGTTSAIEGYASAVSARPGDAVRLNVSTTPAARYRIEIFRLGWYGGAGGRRVACIPACDGDEQGVAQPDPGPPASNPHAEPVRAGWRATDTVRVADDWVSGYYLIRFVLTSGPQSGHYSWTFLIVREPASQHSRILVQVPTNTWQAYNAWGGKSLYDSISPPRSRSYRVSFDRPYGADAQSPFWYELQAVRFLEREGYDVSYQTDLDTHRDPASLRAHRLVITDGHDEYWTKETRDAFDAARDAGVNLAFLGSNTGYWQIRYEDDGRTIMAYKSMYDPEPNVALKTAMFREIGRPECGLMGVQHQYIHPGQYAPHDYTVVGADDPWFAGTGLAQGDKITDVLGPEYDVRNPWPDECFHPGLHILFHFEGSPTMQNGDAVRYTAPSGARVFASGAQRFTWALDTWGTAQFAHTAPANPGVQRFMRNALDDLTRPAPPTGFQLRVGKRRIAAWVKRPTDPAVKSFRVYFHTGASTFDVSSAHVFCESPGFRCLKRIPRGVHGSVRFAAVLVDAWGTSVPLYSDAVALKAPVRPRP